MMTKMIKCHKSNATVSKAAYDQVLWERDVAIQQLREDYGVGLGEKKKHGGWVKASEFMPIYKCSECGERNLFKDGNNVFSNYCPSCGVKMDGGYND